MNNKENDMKRPLDEEVIPEELVEKVSGGTGVDECYLNTAYGVNTAYAFNTSKFF
jgi:hypothetical protein